jgi:hypothetical protein
MCIEGGSVCSHAFLCVKDTSVQCLGLVHVLCGVEDPECTDLHLNVTYKCLCCGSSSGGAYKPR